MLIPNCQDSELGTFWPQSSEVVCYQMDLSLLGSIAIVFTERSQDLLAQLKKTRCMLDSWKH